MKVSLVFDDWQDNRKSIYATEKGVALSMGAFHSGSTFKADIELDDEDAAELLDAMQEGFVPVFECRQRPG